MNLKYKKEDIIPIVLCMFQLLMFDLVNSVFNFAVQKYYPDLKGLIVADNTEPDDSMYLLLRLVKHDQTASVISYYLSLLREHKNQFQNKYGLKTRNAWKNDRILLMARVIYYSDVSYHKTITDGTVALEKLNAVVGSIHSVIVKMCKLIVFNEVELHSEFNDKIWSSLLIDHFTCRLDSDCDEWILVDLMNKVDKQLIRKWG